jgi:hypothetical protein
MSPCKSEEHGRDARNGRTVTEEFDWEGQEAVALAVVDTVARVTKQQTTELAQLSRTIDTDALNTLFRSTGKSGRGAGHVKFTYEGCLVEASADGTLTVTELES